MNLLCFCRDQILYVTLFSLSTCRNQNIFDSLCANQKIAYDFIILLIRQICLLNLPLVTHVVQFIF